MIHGHAGMGFAKRHTIWNRPYGDGSQEKPIVLKKYDRRSCKTHGKVTFPALGTRSAQTTVVRYHAGFPDQRCRQRGLGDVHVAARAPIVLGCCGLRSFDVARLF